MGLFAYPPQFEAALNWNGESNDNGGVGGGDVGRFKAIPRGSVVSGVVKAEHASVRPADASAAYLSAQQVADLVQVSAKTITRWSLEDPSMPVFRRGRVVRFPKEPVLAWFRRQESRSSRRVAQEQRKRVAHPA